MTLTTRLTVFFLAALGAVLLAFSGAIYALARTHLLRQLHDRATATLDTLVAGGEVEPEGLDWEPKERRLTLRGDGQAPLWELCDEDGRRVDGTPDSDRPLDHYAVPGADQEQDEVYVTWEEVPWLVLRRTLRHPHPEAVHSPDGRRRYRVLVFVTAWPAAPVHDTLRTLAWGLAGVSAVLWLLAGLAGRWVCRRALTPVRRMTEAATQVSADGFGERLPVPAARDELHDLAGAFNGLLNRLQDSFERQRRFTGEASHQLRTPLTAMLGQLEVALRRDRDPEEYRRVLASAVGQTGRLQRIVEALLFLARADVEAELPGLEVIELAGWARGYLDAHRHDRGDDIRLVVHESGSVRVRAHPTMLAQVVGNLVDNACKYSHPGTAVNVSVGVEGGEAFLAVEDAGWGIAPEEAARVFEPFFRSAESRRVGVSGLGLGLAVAARIVRSFGGRIEVWSEPGKGSRFTVRLPLLATDAAGPERMSGSP